MKFKEDRPLGNPEAALAKLLEIANALEVDHAGRLSVGAINHAFLTAGGNGAEYGAATHRAVADGWLETHPSGVYVKLTQKDRPHRRAWELLDGRRAGPPDQRGLNRDPSG